jgi:hypothetical protein
MVQSIGSQSAPVKAGGFGRLGVGKRPWAAAPKITGFQCSHSAKLVLALDLDAHTARPIQPETETSRGDGGPVVPDEKGQNRSRMAKPCSAASATKRPSPDNRDRAIAEHRGVSARRSPRICRLGELDHFQASPTTGISKIPGCRHRIEVGTVSADTLWVSRVAVDVDYYEAAVSSQLTPVRSRRRHSVQRQLHSWPNKRCPLASHAPQVCLRH